MKVYFNVAVIGAGGTGGNLIKEFARYLSFFHNDEIGVSLSVVDGDKVEKKNCARQPFIEDDINDFKANVLASAVIDNFGLHEQDVCSFPRYIDTAADLHTVFSAAHENFFRERTSYGVREVFVLVGAVDNHRARQVMHEFFYECCDCVYIDSANEFHVGEVVTGIRIGKKNIAPPRGYYYPDILRDTGKAASELSCGEINASSPQHIATNLFAANLCLMTLVGLIEGRVQGGITYFDSSCMFSRFNGFEGKCPAGATVLRPMKKKKGVK